DPQGRFYIDPRFGIIRTKEKLDHETQSVVMLTVQSQLGNSPVYSSTQVNISVIDVNDNPPVFLTKSDKVIISHTQPPGTAVYIAHADDKDSGLNGAIKYSLASNQSNAFSIDPSLGVVNLTRTVFEDKQQEYTLHIAAEDHGSPPLSSLLLDSLTAKIVILDINDNSPSFMSSSLSYVVEDAEVGFLVHRISAKDPDEGRNGQVTYHIISGNENKSFILDKITGLLSTAQLLDREVQERYSLTVMAIDGGSPALSATQVLTIVVLDVNDERPIFLQQLYETAVRENQDPGELVIKVEAMDRDAGQNSLLQYEILPGTGSEKFRMNSDNGELTTAVSLDRETQEFFSIKGNSVKYLPSRSSTALLYVTVLDENDHSPLFAKNQYHVSVREDLEEGSAILDLFASDEDDGLNGEVTYWLIDDTFGAFAIDSLTGSIVTTKPLDRETKSQYTFRAVASDCSTHWPRSTTVSVVVHVDDVNDNDPVFLQNPIRAFVPAETAVNETVATVRAEDVDLGPNGAVVFSLVPETVFQIDAMTGAIVLQQPLASEDFSARLLVMASDQGTSPRTATAMVIIITEGQEEQISFSRNLYEASVPENSAAG
ncbi:PCD23 protein, partial [Asarcornis scutulata]|nr:PCD23 protein [Asarcornis scutulata]